MGCATRYSVEDNSEWVPAERFAVDRNEQHQGSRLFVVAELQVCVTPSCELQDCLHSLHLNVGLI